MKLGTAHVNIKANLKPLKAGLKKARGMVKSSLGSIGKAATSALLIPFRAIGLVVKGVGVLAKTAFNIMKKAALALLSVLRTVLSTLIRTVKIAAVGFSAISIASIKMAMDAEESENLFEVSMGNMADSVRKWSDAISTALGLNRFEVREFVSVFNVMMESMGIAPKFTAEMSKALTKLAFDMASFFNLKPSEAFQKLQAGITGEAEPLKRLGILISETTVKNFLLTKGIIEQGETLTEQQKVMGRFFLIMEQTKKAQGDLARTLDSTTNVWRTIKTLIKETSIEFGFSLLPAVTKVMIVFRTFLQNNKDAVKAWGEAVVKWVGFVVWVFRRWFGTIKSGEVGKVFEEITAIALNFGGKLMRGVKNVIIPLAVDIGVAIWDALKPQLIKLKNFMLFSLLPPPDELASILLDLKDKITSMSIETGLSFGQNMVDSMITAIKESELANVLADKATEALNKIKTAAKGKVAGTKLGRLAGGEVSGSQFFHGLMSLMGVPGAQEHLLRSITIENARSRGVLEQIRDGGQRNVGDIR